MTLFRATGGVLPRGDQPANGDARPPGLTRRNDTRGTLGTTSTEHEVAVFEREDGHKYILVWIDSDDVETFAETYTDAQWQESIEQHPFVTERNLPVVIAFEDEDGDPRLFGPAEYVEAISDDFDWDSIKWSYNMTLTWETEDE